MRIPSCIALPFMIQDQGAMAAVTTGTLAAGSVKIGYFFRDGLYLAKPGTEIVATVHGTLV
jgi:hypothetical protein